uniref:Uncharacterized protein n=1 Tax=Leersia perrieri TaxID=77586 RepID=A0A0D9X9Y0_9ORYZ
MNEEKSIIHGKRNTDLFLYGYLGPNDFSSSDFIALFHEEAASIFARCPCLQDIDLEIVRDCCLYGFFVYYHSCLSSSQFIWPAHASNCWTCDGVVQGARAWEISNALHPEINFQCDFTLLKSVFRKLNMDPRVPFLVLEDYDEFIHLNKPYRWVSVTSRNRTIGEAMQPKIARASSIFLARAEPERYIYQRYGYFSAQRYWDRIGIPDGFFEQCSNLGVLVLSYCAFNFVSPPFLHCHTLKFLGLDSCTSNNTNELQAGGHTTKWACLQSLSVIDLHYTDWVGIFHEEKMELMANLMEVNTKGVRCSQLTSRLQKRLPCLKRLRVINPVHEAETSSSTDIKDLFVGKTDLQLLDMSGNREMENLPTSISEASKLKVLILDGCDALKDVVVPDRLPSSLRSFSFDGYGPADGPNNWATTSDELPPQSCRRKRPGDNIDVKTSVISLIGCTQLENLFLRGLPNLVELDLSGCAIKVLDFGTMVTGVRNLKWLFLLGCEHLCAIRWGPNEEQAKRLQLLCIDTRPARKVLGFARPSLAVVEQEPKWVYVHACIVDARLVRSLLPMIRLASGYGHFFNISITSSMASGSGIVQPETTSKKMTESSDEQHYGVASIYGTDVFSKVGDAVTAMQSFPFPPLPEQKWDYRHIEIGDGSRNVESEVAADYDSDHLVTVMARFAESLHVHDVSTGHHILPGEAWQLLLWCHVERCSNLDTVFPPDAVDTGTLHTIWASDLLKARCIYGAEAPSHHMWQSTNVIKFPKLTTIHLYNLPALRQICEAVETMVAPALETIRIKGCSNLRRLPSLKGRTPGMDRPTVEVEKHVWDGLEWDGVDAGHCPLLFQLRPWHHSHYSQHKRLPRGSLLSSLCEPEYGASAGQQYSSLEISSETDEELTGGRQGLTGGDDKVRRWVPSRLCTGSAAPIPRDAPPPTPSSPCRRYLRYQIQIRYPGYQFWYPMGTNSRSGTPGYRYPDRRGGLIGGWEGAVTGRGPVDGEGRRHQRGVASGGEGRGGEGNRRRLVVLASS